MSTLPALIGFQVPQFNLGETFTQMARLAAFDQARRTSALELEEKRGKLDRESQVRQLLAASLQPQAQVPGQGFAAASPVQASTMPQGAPSPPGVTSQGGPPPMGAPGQPGGFTATMAQQVPPATAEQGSYAQLAPGGAPSGMPSSYGTAPMDLQSRAGLEAMAGSGAPSGRFNGMPPEITAMARPVDPTQPPLQGGGFTVAPPQAQAPAPPQGLTAPQPTRPLQASVPGLMPMPDMQKVQQAVALDPTYTSQWLGAYLGQRGKQLEEVKRNNQLVYQVTSAMLEHPDYYQEGLDYLREQGVPVPKNMPTTYNAALVAFHRDVSRERLNPLEDAQRENQLAQAQFHQAQARTAGTNQQIVPKYTGDAQRDSLIHSEMQQRGLTGNPPQAVLDRVEARIQQGKVDVSTAQGAGQAQQGSIAAYNTEQLKKAGAMGSSAQSTLTTLNQMQTLMQEGVYGNTWGDMAQQAAYRLGLNPSDQQAIRTNALREYGNQLILDAAQGKLGAGVSNKDVDIFKQAVGNFQQAKNLAEMQESLAQMQGAAKRMIGQANTMQQTFQRGGKLPDFGDESHVQTVTRQDFDTFVQKHPEKTRDQWRRQFTAEGLVFRE